ncbi:MAG: glycosidase [Melioribacter sp.]|uniref:glycoside hydrolase family 130 protein n=1 Tax=Melioribacter sp. TaxID=2052167 RepID=UPI003BD7A60C
MGNSRKELFKRYSGNPIITVNDLPYQANSVFNCGATKIGDEILLLMRVEDMRGISHLTVARSKDGITNWKIDEKPTMPPEPDKFPEEIWGIEDPRITYIDELKKYAITYTAYSHGGPLVSLALTEDFKTFEKFGAVLPPEDKDAALFPIKFNDRWAMIHRPIISTPQSAAHMWISFSPDLIHWGEHRILVKAREGAWWDANKIGLSPPPLLIPEGWLVMYHGVKKTASGAIYRLGLLLLDKENPTKILKRSDEWIFGPLEPYETKGDVDNVVFPCGWYADDKTLYIYYGAADTSIALATADLNEVRDYVSKLPEGESPKRWG